MRNLAFGMAALALLGGCAQDAMRAPIEEARRCRNFPDASERDRCFERLEQQGYVNVRDQVGGRYSEEGTARNDPSGGASSGGDSGSAGGASGGSAGAGGGGGAGGGAGGAGGGAGGGGLGGLL